MNEGFLKLVTVAGRSRNETYSRLADYYNNETDLYQAVSILLDSSLDIEKVKGKKVLLKPNWVKHSLAPLDELCLRTNDNFTLSVLKNVLNKEPLSVVIGDAPIQGCVWEKMISQSLISQINKLSKDYNIPVQVKDFRRRSYTMQENSPLTELRPLKDYVIFNLADNSLLEPITNSKKNRFRVTNYNPDRLALSHARGIHKYCITKELFDADLILSLPKIKTHQKTAITGALKNLVGLNGDKDFLPHHRIGGTARDGDCYPGNSYLRYWSELSLDLANRNQGNRIFWLWQKLSSFLWTLSRPGPEHNMDAGWHGNDTTWRMVVDLNRIAEFGRPDGTISNIQQRQVFSMCDGIIGGQGNGPLYPEPLPLGIISFTNDSYLNDLAMAILMLFSPDKIPLLNYYVHCDRHDNYKILLNGKRISLGDLNGYAIKTKPPMGWVTHFQYKP